VEVIAGDADNNGGEMKLPRRRWVLGVLVMVALIGGGWLFFGHNGEPRYEGRLVSYWFREFCYANTDQRYHDDYEPEAEEALRKIGTNALPYLLKQAFDTNEDSSLRTNLNEMFKEFPETWHMPRFVRRQDFRNKAPGAIAIVNPPASVILPLMLNELAQTGTPNHSAAIGILFGVTNSVEILVPYFIKALHDSNLNDKILALYALGKIGPRAAAAVPDLIELLQKEGDMNTIRLIVPGVLADIGSNSATATPILKEMFEKETKWAWRCALAVDLCKIDSQQAEAFDFLMKSLTNFNDVRQIRLTAFYLPRIGPDAKRAIPTLLNALDTTNLDAWSMVLKSLRALGVSNEVVMPRVREKLTVSDEKLRLAAAEEVLIVDKANAQAQAVLVALIKDHSALETTAIAALGRAGPAASSAIPVIVAALDGTNPENWSEVPQALTNMGAPTTLFLSKLEDKTRPDIAWHRENYWVLLRIAGTILQADPANRNAQLALVRLMGDAYESGKLGAVNCVSNAQPVIPELQLALQNTLKSDDPKLRKAAAAAIKKIDTRVAGK
jgi:HEAT repeat protein